MPVFAARRRPEPQTAAMARTAGNPSDERLDVMGRIMGCEMLIGAWSERLVVLEMGGYGSFVRLPELCLSVFGRFVTERR
jgi:hypothetical protein